MTNIKECDTRNAFTFKAPLMSTRPILRISLPEMKQASSGFFLDFQKTYTKKKKKTIVEGCNQCFC